MKPLIDGAPVNSVRPKITMSFDSIDGGYQTLAILDDGAVALGIEEAFDGLGYQSQVFPRHSIPPYPPTRVPLFPIGPSPSRILGRNRPLPPSTNRKDTFGIQRQHLFEPYIVLPVVVEIILIQKAFTETKTELAQANTFRVIGEREASLVRNAVIFPVDVKPMQVGITPTHGNLNRVMKVGNAVVAPQEQSPPDHRANATQNHLELVNAQHLGARHGALLYCHGLRCQKVSSIRWASTQFFMLSMFTPIRHPFLADLHAAARTSSLHKSFEKASERHCVANRRPVFSIQLLF